MKIYRNNVAVEKVADAGRAAMDADFATDLHTLDTILPIIDKYEAFTASRHCGGAKI